MSGPYRGLSQNSSAVEVTTVIHEQFNALDNMKQRGEIRGIGLGLAVDEQLRKRQMDTDGVRDSLLEGWNQFSSSEECYREIISDLPSDQHRSEITDESTLSLYTSFFDGSLQMNEQEVTYISGTKEKG